MVYEQHATIDAPHAIDRNGIEQLQNPDTNEYENTLLLMGAILAWKDSKHPLSCHVHAVNSNISRDIQDGSLWFYSISLALDDVHRVHAFSPGSSRLAMPNVRRALKTPLL